VEEFQDSPALSEPVFVGSEDSLSLNVVTPACDEKRRPVIIYVHGGANWLESSRVSLYHTDALVARGDVVTVTFNYRLGIFGALDLSVLGEDAPRGAHANCVRDQLCAIDWVRHNISCFGGDPNNITLVGESAGSMDISWMIASGSLKGRVKRLVMMSGVGSVTGFGHDHTRSVHSLEEGRSRALRFLRELGITTFAELQALSTESLLTRCAEVVRRSDILFDMDTLFYPRVDPPFCEEDPFIAAQSGAADDFDILIGFTGYEMGLWLTWDDDLDRRSAAWAIDVCPFLPAQLKYEMNALYQKEFAHESDGVRGMHVLGDAMFGAPSLIFANSVAQGHGRCWMYRFDYPCDDPRRRALHAADVIFFLGTWNSPSGQALMGKPQSEEVRAQRESLSGVMQDVLIAFARTGDPATKETSTWKPFSPSQRGYIRFDTTCQVAMDPLGGRTEFWLKSIAEPVLHGK
jgi:para-nitrobenzyl esterase